MILDGFGLNEKHEANAVYEAKTPNIDRLMKEYPFVKGYASGTAGWSDGKFRGWPHEYGSRPDCISGIDENYQGDRGRHVL